MARNLISFICYYSVKEELEEVIIQREVSLANLKKKHSEDISELNNTIENHLKSRQRYVVYQVFHHLILLVKKYIDIRKEGIKYFQIRNGEAGSQARCS